MTRRTTTTTRRATLGGIAVLALSGCGLIGGGTQGPEDPTEEERSDGQESTEESPEEGSEQAEDGATEEGTGSDEGSGAVGDPTEVTIGETLTDEELGEEITVVSAIRDMTSERHGDFIAEGGEVNYVQVEVSPSGEWGGALGTTDFAIEGHDNAEVNLLPEMRDNGYTPLDTYARRDGDSGPLWLAFTVHEQAEETYTMVYTRAESEVIGEDRTLPEFRGEVTIPAA